MPPATAQPDAPAAPGSLLDIASLGPEGVRRLLGEAQGYDEPGTPPPPTGQTVANLFFEDSTRTRVSFTVAAQRVGAAAIDLTAAGSSVSKGETLEDTARTVEAMGVSALVVRTQEPGGAAMIARAVQIPVLNAGDGRHAHPTQGLLDAYTVAEAHGRLGSFDLSGLRVLIAGDIAHSRVARSDIAAMTMLGASVTVAGPPALAPASLRTLGCDVTEDFDAALAEADAVQMLRVQRERGAQTGSLRSFTARYQLHSVRAAAMKSGAIVMHPGPMNRGVEIEGDVADSPRSRITRQVAVGVMVRAAVLRRALGERP